MPRFQNIAVLIAFALFSLTPFGHATDATKSLSPKYRHWVNEEVPYIISTNERKQFLGLKSDQERDTYIEAFWQSRNTTPGSDLNAFKEEHYRRLAYVNEHFGSSELQDGWRTDQGRVYITIGAPQQIVTYPNARNVRPIIIWFYQSPTPALPTHFNVMFYKRDSGDPYTLYSPYQDGPTRLTTGLEDLNVPERSIKTIQKSLGEEVARTSLSLIPTEPVDLNNYNPSMQSDVMLATIRGLADNALTRQEIDERRGREVVTGRILMSLRPAEIEAASFREVTGQQTASLLFMPHESIRGLIGTLPDGKLGYSLRLETIVTTKSGARVYGAETALQGTMTDNEAAAARTKRFAAEERLPLAPGDYKVTCTLMNALTRVSVKEEQMLTVPDLSNDPWNMSGLLAFAQPSGTADAGRSPFSISGVRFAPRGVGETSLHPTEPLWVAFQLWAKPPNASAVAAVDSGLAGHKIKATFSWGNLQSGQTPETETEEISGADFDSSGNLLTGHKIDTAKLEPGTYRLAITVIDEQTNLKAFRSMSFRIVPWSEPTEMWTAHFTSGLDKRSDAMDDYKRGLSALAQGQSDAAVKWLSRSLNDDSEYVPALERVVVLLSQNHQFAEVAAIAKSHPASASLNKHTAILMADANDRIGQPHTGSQILEAELQFQTPDSALYLELAKLYQAENDVSKAEEFKQKAAALKN